MDKPHKKHTVDKINEKVAPQKVSTTDNYTYHRTLSDKVHEN